MNENSFSTELTEIVPLLNNSTLIIRIAGGAYFTARTMVKKSIRYGKITVINELQVCFYFAFYNHSLYPDVVRRECKF